MYPYFGLMLPFFDINDNNRIIREFLSILSNRDNSLFTISWNFSLARQPDRGFKEELSPGSSSTSHYFASFTFLLLRFFCFVDFLFASLFFFVFNFRVEYGHYYYYYSLFHLLSSKKTKLYCYCVLITALFFYLNEIICYVSQDPLQNGKRYCIFHIHMFLRLILLDYQDQLMVVFQIPTFFLHTYNQTYMLLKQSFLPLLLYRHGFRNLFIIT